MKFALIKPNTQGTFPAEIRVAVVDADSYEEAEQYARRKYPSATVEEVEDSMPATVVIPSFYRDAATG